MFVIKLFVGFSFFTATLGISPMIVPAFHWNHRNPIFQKNSESRKPCTEPAHIYVRPRAEMNFVCPHIALDTAASKYRLHRYYLYENIHLVSKRGFDTCTVDLPKSLFMNCDKSERIYHIRYELMMFSIVMWNGWQFFPNNTYYFINTSNGTKQGLKNMSGGRCKTHNMKLKVTVCLPEQECDKCENMCCEKPTTAPPVTTMKTTLPSTTLPSATLPLTQNNSMSVTSNNTMTSVTEDHTMIPSRKATTKFTRVKTRTPATPIGIRKSVQRSKENDVEYDSQSNKDSVANVMINPASQRGIMETNKTNISWIIIAAVVGLIIGFGISTVYFLKIKPGVKRCHNNSRHESQTDTTRRDAAFSRLQSVTSSVSTEPTEV